MKRIVAAADFSPWSRQAMDRAAQIARANSAELHVVNVPAHGLWSQGQGMLAQYLGGGEGVSTEDERARLAKSASGVAKRFKVRPECHVVPGRPAEEIAAFAATQEAALVVLGTRGHGRLRPQAIGGTALKVLWQSLLPVLLVRQPADDAYRRVLVAVDLDERSAHVCRAAMDLFPKAAITLLHAFRGEHETALQLLGATPEAQRRYVVDIGNAAAEAFEALADELAESSGRKIARVITHSHPLPAILGAATELQADVVVLGKHSGSHLEERILGSVVQNLVQQLKTDVLVIA